MFECERAAVIGANGTMGVGSAALLVSRGIPTTLLCRSEAKARAAREAVQKRLRSSAVVEKLEIASYDALESNLLQADLVLEALAERVDLKRSFLQRMSGMLKPTAVVGTVSSGLSIAALCEGIAFKSRFMGMHLYNPPSVLTACEIVSHAAADRALVDEVSAFFARRLGRDVVHTADTAAFIGNRVGFHLLNQAAQLAEEHGPAYIDLVLGRHTGRTMPPLATVDFVGLDVHAAIADNIHQKTRDEAHSSFALPASLRTLVKQGRLGQKSGELGGYFRTHPAAGAQSVCLPSLEWEALPTEVPELVLAMRQANRCGQYQRAFELMCEAKGKAGQIMRKVLLGYISYSYYRVGEVVQSIGDVDRVMATGFGWAPPSLVAAMFGRARILQLLGEHSLPVPPLLQQHVESKTLAERPSASLCGRYFLA